MRSHAGSCCLFASSRIHPAAHKFTAAGLHANQRSGSERNLGKIGGRDSRPKLDKPYRFRSEREAGDLLKNVAKLLVEMISSQAKSAAFEIGIGSA